MKRKILLFTLIISQFYLLQAQTGLTVAQETANEVISKLSCNQSTISNITFVGDKLMLGSFDGSKSNIGLKEGIILSTGKIVDAIGPNNSSSTGLNLNLIGDADLEKVFATTNITHDAAVLEFDFIAVSDTLNIRYVFASEEYLEYVHSNFNDLMGCFLSGPGIAGPYSNNAVNIAIIPGTQSYVGVNTINHKDAPQFLIDNGSGTDSSATQFDAFTKPLRAQYSLTIGQSYHIKFVIADASDHIYDSGLFIESNAFSSHSFNITKTTTNPILFENCDTAGINIQMIPSKFNIGKIAVQILGSATNGIDMQHIADSVTIDPITGMGHIVINPLDDNTIDGDKTLELIFQTSDCLWDTSRYIIRDFDLVLETKNYISCMGIPVVLEQSIVTGDHLWSNNETTNSITITVPGTYYAEISHNSCGIFTDTFVVSETPNCKPNIIEMTVWPNPASTNINLTTDGNTYHLRIVDITGSILQEFDVNNYTTPIDVSMLEAGVYFIQLLNANSFHSIKFVKTL